MLLLFVKTFALLFGFESAVGCHPGAGMAVDVTANSAILVWSASTCDGVTGYAIYLANSYYRPQFVANITSQYNYYSLSNLNPGSVYSYRVQSYTHSGARLHPTSRGISVHTAQASPSSPTGLLVATSSRTATVSWDGCSRATTYHVGYKENTARSSWITVEATSQSVIISNLQPSTAYQFRVHCENNAGRSSFSNSVSKTTLSDRDLPVPAPLVTSSVTSRIVRVSWSSCTGATAYYVDFKKTTSTHWTRVEISGSLSTQITDLHPSTTYNFRIQCAYSIYTGPYSRWSTTTTHSEVPSSVRVSSLSTTSITATISWRCTGATKYFINYAKAVSGEPETSISVNRLRATIRNLLPNTTYNVTVVCENEYGRDSSSTPKNFQTKSYQPTIQSVVAFSTGAVVTWRPRAQGDVQMSYEILATGNNGHRVHTPTAYGSYRHTVVHLRSETVYSFQVRAVSTSEGRSSWSEPMNAITLPEFPGQVINFATNETTESSVVVSWKSPFTTVDFFVIRLTLQSAPSSNISTVEVSLGNSTEMYTFHKLLPLTSYNVSIWAVNKAGQGPVVSLNVDTLELTAAPNTLVASLGAVIGLLLFAVLIGVILLACVIRRNHLALNHKSNSKERETTEGLSYLQCRQDADSREANSYGLPNVYSEDDENSIRSVHVSETELFFKSLTLPPRIPARDYVQEEPMIKPSLQFTSLPVWPDEVAFQKESGWFDPSLSHVLRKKLSYREEDFRKLGSGIFYMFHKSKKKARYINYSFDLGRSLSDLLSKLYEKERCDLNPLEVELKYYSPSADKWCIRVWRCEKKALLLERTKRIIEYQTLRPHGLNKHLKVAGREMWAELSEWYEKHRPKHVKKAALT